MGEGSGVLVLEELEHARARGAHIYAEVVGYGANCDAYHFTAPAPGGTGAIDCMKLTLADAGIAPEQVDHINAHGTGTHMNDACETAAIHAVFGEHAKQLTVVSTKSMTGHLLGVRAASRPYSRRWPCETSLLRPPSTTSSLTRNAIWTMCPMQAVHRP